MSCECKKCGSRNTSAGQVVDGVVSVTCLTCGFVFSVLAAALRVTSNVVFRPIETAGDVMDSIGDALFGDW